MYLNKINDNKEIRDTIILFITLEDRDKLLMVIKNCLPELSFQLRSLFLKEKSSARDWTLVQLLMMLL